MGSVSSMAMCCAFAEAAINDTYFNIELCNFSLPSSAESCLVLTQHGWATYKLKGMITVHALLVNKSPTPTIPKAARFIIQKILLMNQIH